MSKNTKAHHSAIQSEIASLNAQLKDFNDSKPTMMDFLVNREYQKGITSLDRISNILKIPKNSIISNLSTGIFSLFGDTIESKG